VPEGPEVAPKPEFKLDPLLQLTGQATQVFVAGFKTYPALQILHKVVTAVVPSTETGSQAKQLAAVHATHVPAALAVIVLLTKLVAQAPIPT